MNFFSAKMVSYSLSLILAVSSLLMAPTAFSQETRYIRDTLFVPLRSGQSFKHRIVHKGLASGTPLTLLEVSEDGSYSMVRTAKGVEGWLQTQYLSQEPAARSQLDAIKAKNQTLSSANNTLNKELSSIKKQLNDAKLTITKLTENQLGTTKELNQIKEISANAITLNKDNKELLQEKQELLNELDMVKAENQRLNDSLDNEEFMNGVFAVLIGVIITLLIPRLWPKKSTEWA